MSVPITRKITRLGDGSHVGWSLYTARAALKAIGITAPKAKAKR